MQRTSRTRQFEDLIIFQQAKKIAISVYNLTRKDPLRTDFGLRSQMQRSAVSIISNIAEGYERGSNTEFMQFLYVAKGSCGEIRAQVILCRELKYIDKNPFEELTKECRILSPMIAKFIHHLKTSSYRGPKHNPPIPNLIDPH